MNLDVLRSYIRELLFEVFSPRTISDMTLKFKKEDPNIDANEIRFYLDKFSNVQASPHVSEKNIQKYSWHTKKSHDGTEILGLKDFIDSKWSTRSFYEPVEITDDLQPVYQSEDGSLQIFLGDMKEKCITIRKNFEERTNKRYTWCISRSDASNLFRGYRYRQSYSGMMDQPVFYYIFDIERITSDPLHACVIYVTNEGKYWLSNANNKGDREYSWSALATMMPKIKDIQNVFKHIPLTERQLDTHAKTKDKLSNEEFARLTRDLKEDYISRGHELTEEQIRNIWNMPQGDELVNVYCNRVLNVFIPLDIYKKLPGSTKKVIKENFKNQNLYMFFYEGKTKFRGDLYLVLDNLPTSIMLPDIIETSGNLRIDGNEFTKLPSTLIVGGTLSIKGENITELPEKLRVGKSLYIISGTGITNLPYGLDLNILDIRGTKIKEIPPGTKCDRLYMSRTEISSIENVIIRQSLDADESKLTQLPEGLNLEFCNINNTQISRLPTRFTADNLSINGTKISELPSGFRVKNRLDISNTDISFLPDDIRADAIVAHNTKISVLRGNIVGERGEVGLFLHGSPIKEIEPGFTITGHLSLGKNTELKFLPEITVNGCLDIAESEIEQISPFVKAHRIKIGKKLVSIPENWNVPETLIEILNNQHIKRIPLIKARKLYIYNSGIESIDEGCELKELQILFSNIRLPENLHIMSLKIKDSTMQTLPRGLVVDTLSLERTNIKSLPSDIIVNNEINPAKFKKMYDRILEKRKLGMAESLVYLKKLIHMTLKDLI